MTASDLPDAPGPRPSPRPSAVPGASTLPELPKGWQRHRHTVDVECAIVSSATTDWEVCVFENGQAGIDVLMRPFDTVTDPVLRHVELRCSSGAIDPFGYLANLYTTLHSAIATACIDLTPPTPAEIRLALDWCAAALREAKVSP